MADSDSETVSTPRRRLPLVTEKNSPRTVKPLASLDLSDEENGRVLRKSSVLPVSHHSDESDDSEVVINYSRLSQKTPVRVIRHKNTCEHKNTSEELRSISNCSGEVCQVEEETKDDGLSVLVTRHYEKNWQSDGSIHKSVIDGKSPTTKIESSNTGLKHSNSAAVHYKALVEMSQKSKSLQGSADSDGASYPSTAAAGDPRESCTSAANVKSVTVPGIEEVSGKLNQKKKGGRIIASRYMQAANSARGPLKATDHSLLPKSGAPVGSGAVRTGATSKSKQNSSWKEQNAGVARRGESNKSSTSSHHTSASSRTESKKEATSSANGVGRHKRSNSGPSLVNCTPQPSASSRECDDVRGGKGGGRGLVSTPTADGSMFVAPDTVDVSAIISVSSKHPSNMIQSYLDDGCSDLAVIPCHGLFKRNMCSTSSNSSSRSQGSVSHTSQGSMTHTSQGSMTHTSSDASDLPHVRHLDQAASSSRNKVSRELTQWDVELAYGRQVQWAFIAAMARKSFREQEKAAMTDIQTLWEAVELQKQRVQDIKAELTKLYYRSTVSEMIQLQSSSLNAMEDNLDELMKQHSSLVSALETTCHHMKTRGIYVPVNDQKYMDDICASLTDSYQLLSHIVGATFQQAPSIGSYSQCLDSLDGVVSDQVLKMTRANELLSAIQSLTTRENSLRIQLLQDR